MAGTKGRFSGLKGFTIFLGALAALNVIISLTVAQESPLKSHALRFVDLSGIKAPGDVIPLYDVLQTEKKYGSSLIYRENFFKRHLKFIYPPTALVFFRPLQDLDRDRFIFVVTSVINRIFLLFGIVVIFWLFNRWANRAGRTPIDAVLQNLSVALLLFTFYPYFKAFTLGQAQIWINASILFSLLAYDRGQEGLSGAAMGFCTLIKPSYGLVLLWGLLAKRRRFAAAFLIVVLCGLAASLILYGWQNHLDYVRVLNYVGQHGEGYYPNQSINGFLNRLLHNGNNLHWVADKYPPENALVRWGTSLSSLLILGLALAFCWKNRKRLNLWPYLIMLLSITIASPIAWEHTYGFTFIIFVLLGQAIFRGGLKNKGAWVAAIAVSYLLSSHFLHFLNTTFAETGWNFLQSYLLLGELILLTLMYRLQKRADLVT
jgi:alpha-1,2-mannosyltransferase